MKATKRTQSSHASKTPSFDEMRMRARRLGWTLRRLNQRGMLAARFSLKVGDSGSMRASDLSFIALLITEAEKRNA